MVRALAIVVLVACGSTEPAPTGPSPSPSPPRAPVPVVTDAGAPIGAAAATAAPTFRLPGNVVPVHYAVRLEIDPAKDAFAGVVAIRVRLEKPTRTIWLHAQDLTIAKASYARGDAIVGKRQAHDLQPIELPREELPGEITIELHYTGKADPDRDQEGLFRQQGFVFSQAEAAFARRIVPCLDEPGFKVSWKVTIVAPKAHVALANAPAERETVLPDGRRETVFATIDAMPTYLFAIAVGTFVLVDGGTVGRNQVPLRIAVAAKDRKRTAYAVQMTGKLVERLEAYFDMPLPVAKLDFVAVPELFGAMEHPGLVTYSREILLGNAADRGYRRRFLRVAAHELAHQWMGNLVTMAWWDDLWLAEAFATFLGDKAAAEVGAFADDPLRLLLDLEDARAADAEPAPAALHRAIADGDDVDETFDAIAYEKGRAVLVMFERFVGEAVMRDAVRAYVAAHARRNATTADFAAALAKAARDPAVGRALESVVRHRGAPVVDLELRCTANGTPALIGTARGGVVVPVCVRYPAASTCALVGPRAELALTGARDCVPWLVGNDQAAGYYQVVQAQSTVAPLGTLAPAERLARAHDVAGAVRRGELAIDKAAAVAAALASSGDPYAQLGAAAIAQAIDPVIADSDRAAWTAWLAKAFAPVLTARALLSPRNAVEYARRDAVLAAVPGAALGKDVVGRARKALVRALGREDQDLEILALALRLAAHTVDKPLWQVIRRALATGDEDLTAVLLAGAAAVPPAFAPDLVAAIDAAKLPSAERAAVYAALAATPAMRAAAWPLIAGKLASIVTALKPADARALVGALGQTCDKTIRDALPPAPPDAVEAARLALDRCLARKAAAGSLRLPAE